LSSKALAHEVTRAVEDLLGVALGQKPVKNNGEKDEEEGSDKDVLGKIKAPTRPARPKPAVVDEMYADGEEGESDAKEDISESSESENDGDEHWSGIGMEPRTIDDGMYARIFDAVFIINLLALEDNNSDISDANTTADDRRNLPVKAKAKTTASAAQSTFLPSLSVGYTRGDSPDSAWSDGEQVADGPLKKNRRGQRARRAYVPVSPETFPSVSLTFSH
jgi:hypothetical protein